MVEKVSIICYHIEEKTNKIKIDQDFHASFEGHSTWAKFFLSDERIASIEIKRPTQIMIVEV